MLIFRVSANFFIYLFGKTEFYFLFNERFDQKVLTVKANLLVKKSHAMRWKSAEFHSQINMDASFSELSIKKKSDCMAKLSLW